MSLRTSVLALVATVVACPLAANATTINFASLSQPGTGITTEGSSYTQQGFTFAGGTLAVYQASSPNLPGLAAANTSLFDYFADDETSITAAGNAPFTLNSIDLAPLVAGSGPTTTFDVTFIGTLADASTVNQTFTVADSAIPELQTFDFTNFTNVVSVSFEQGTNIGFFAEQDTAYQFDNVVVNSTSSTSVPEPGTLSLCAITVAGLIFRSGKRTAR
jgi:hypothetical protein